MTTVWLTIAKAIAAELGPVALAWFSKEVLPQILDKLGEGFEKNLPALTAALVDAVANAAAGGVDKVTDIIPGDTDDRIIDPLVARGLEIFRQVLGR